MTWSKNTASNDLGVPLTKTGNETWLLEADGEILWVVGHRAAQAFKVPKDSTNYLVISSN